MTIEDDFLRGHVDNILHACVDHGNDADFIRPWLFHELRALCKKVAQSATDAAWREFDERNNRL